MRSRAWAVVAAMGAGVLGAAIVAACFPEYAVGGGDAGAGEGGSGSGSGGGSGSGSSSGSGSGSSSGSSGGDGGTLPWDGGAIGYDGSVPTGMAAFGAGVYHLQVYGAASNNSWTNKVDATVTLSHAFAIDLTETTVGAFRKWVDAGSPAPDGGGALDPSGPYTQMVWDSVAAGTSVTNPAYLGYDAGCTNSGGKAPTWGAGNDAFPMSCVNWFQAEAYCAWAGKRLPTDTEWRIAATSGGANPEYPWGGTADPTCSQAIGDFSTSPNDCAYPVPVASTPAGQTPTGIFDLAGSLTEWQWDLIAQSGYAYPAEAGTDYAGPPPGTVDPTQRQWFGGSYDESTVTYFQNWAPGATFSQGAEGFDNQGFRCAKTLP